MQSRGDLVGLLHQFARRTAQEFGVVDEHARASVRMAAFQQTEGIIMTTPTTDEQLEAETTRLVDESIRKHWPDLDCWKMADEIFHEMDPDMRSGELIRWSATMNVAQRIISRLDHAATDQQNYLEWKEDFDSDLTFAEYRDRTK